IDVRQKIGAADRRLRGAYGDDEGEVGRAHLDQRRRRGLLIHQRRTWFMVVTSSHTPAAMRIESIEAIPVTVKYPFEVKYPDTDPAIHASAPAQRIDG